MQTWGRHRGGVGAALGLSGRDPVPLLEPLDAVLGRLWGSVSSRGASGGGDLGAVGLLWMISGGLGRSWAL